MSSWTEAAATQSPWALPVALRADRCRRISTISYVIRSRSYIIMTFFLSKALLRHGALLHHGQVVSVHMQLLLKSCVPGVSFVEDAKEVVMLSRRHSIGVAFVRNEATCFFARPFVCLLFFNFESRSKLARP